MLFHLYLIGISLLIIAQNATAEKQFVEFDSYYYLKGSSKPWQAVNVVPSSETYKITKQVLTFTQDGEQTVDYKANLKDKLKTANCHYFLSYNRQNDGIYTCQDDENQQFAIPAGDVIQELLPVYYAWRIACEDLVNNIMEGEDVVIACTMKRITPLNYHHYKITIGWIQGNNTITQSHNLNTNPVSFNLRLKANQSGYGILFYCISEEIPFSNQFINLCYTLLLTVYPPQLITDTDRKQNTVGEHCFKCQAAGGSDQNIYNWTLNGQLLSGTEYNGEDDNEKCFRNAIAGDYVVQCLVNTEENSDEIEPIAGDITETYKNEAGCNHDPTTLPTSRSTTTDQHHSTDHYKSSATTVDQFKQPVTLALAASTVFLLIVFLVLICLLKKKSSKTPQPSGSNQRYTNMNVFYTSNVPQTRTREDGNISDAEVPPYFVLES